MSNRAWMPLHIADYLSDTGHLTATEHGAYLLLIMHYWQNGALPESERVIARIAKMSAEQWEESRDILAMLFGPGWTHKRIDAELSKADEIIEKRRAAAEARYSKGKEYTSDANAMHVQSKCSDTGVPPTTNNLSSSLRSEDAPRVIEKRTPRDELGQVLDAEHIDAVIQHRQRIRKPLTSHAAKLLAAKFAQCPNPNEAADAMVSNGWQGFEIEWMANRSVPRRQAQAPPVRERTIFDAIDDFTGKNDHGLSAGKTIEHDDGGDYPPHVHVIAPPQRGRR